MTAFCRTIGVICLERHGIESVVEDTCEVAVRGRSRTGDQLAVRFAGFRRFSANHRVVERDTYLDAAAG